MRPDPQPSSAADQALAEVLTGLRQDPDFMRCVTAWKRLPARPSRTVPWPANVDRRLVEAVKKGGVSQLYTHQAHALEAVQAGRHIVIATPTASGKTLAYNLPILHDLLNDPAACALYLFPTKALAHDQLAALTALLADPALAPARLSAHTFDGDTPPAQRSAIRRDARLLITNPDMLHTGILPHHTRWARLFANLRYVVLDELHVYRGVFGAHVANVLRRLQRICRFYGAAPRFLCASATIANPRELAERLIEWPVELVDDDGAPQGEKHFLFYNPPLVEPELGLRRSATLAAQEIAARFLRANVQTVVFARARLTTEILLGYLRDAVAPYGLDAARVRGYRGGYLPTERRQIEAGLRSGQIRGVVATNALELGVDIGQLDACVLAGFPGTIASTWQQAGRAGRRAGLSAAVLVASAAPLDQYLITHPQYFFGRPVEHALLDANNLVILANHLACAVYELPFAAGEPFGGFTDAQHLLEALVAEGVLYRRGQDFVWIGEGYPAAKVSLRTSTPDTVVIQDVSLSPPQTIGQLDRPSAPRLVHTGAIYLHEGATYAVENLDWERGIASVRAIAVDYYTKASVTTDVQVVQVHQTAQDERLSRAWGEVLVTERVTGYRIIKRYTHEVLGWAPLDLPEQTLRTVGCWFAIPDDLAQRLQDAGVLLEPLDYGPNWPAQRDAARARDGYRCRYCGAPEPPGRQHDVHHLTPFRAFGYVAGKNDHYLQANRLENLITLCPACHRRVEQARGARTALSGLAYLLQNLAPLHLMCDPGDLGTVVQSYGPPTVTVYDEVPGGAGLSARLYEIYAEVLQAALDVVTHCPCTDGCPSCVGPVGETAEPDTKRLTRQLLTAVLEERALDQAQPAQRLVEEGR